MDPFELKSEGCATLQKAEGEEICPSDEVKLYWNWSLGSGPLQYPHNPSPADVERLNRICDACPKYVPLED